MVVSAGDTKEEPITSRKLIEVGQIRPAVNRAYSRGAAAAEYNRIEVEHRLGTGVHAKDDRPTD